MQFKLLTFSTGLRQRIEQTTENSVRKWLRLPHHPTIHPKMIVIIPSRGLDPTLKSFNQYDPEVRVLMKKKEMKDGEPDAEQPVKAEYQIEMAGYPDKAYPTPLHYTTVNNKVTTINHRNHGCFLQSCFFIRR